MFRAVSIDGRSHGFQKATERSSGVLCEGSTLLNTAGVQSSSSPSAANPTPTAQRRLITVTSSSAVRIRQSEEPFSRSVMNISIVAAMARPGKARYRGGGGESERSHMLSPRGRPAVRRAIPSEVGNSDSRWCLPAKISARPITTKWRMTSGAVNPNGSTVSNPAPCGQACVVARVRIACRIWKAHSAAARPSGTTQAHSGRPR